MSDSTWVMQRAGILGDGLSADKPIDKLTPYARYQFIEDVINELTFGTPNIPFICGNVPSTPLANSIQDLHDETKYPDFHRNWVDTYEKIAIGLNHPGAFLATPFIDFTVMIPNLQLSLPDWSPELAIQFPKWKLKYGIDLALEIPKLSVEIPSIGINIPLPPEPLGINLPQLAFMFKAILKLPSIIIDLALSLVAKLPSFLPLPLKLPNLFVEICKTIKEKIFPKDPVNEGILDVTNAAAASVLARKTTELSLLSTMGMLVGSGPLVLGGLGSELGYTSPNPVEDVSPYYIDPGVRGRVATTALNAVGLHSSREPYYSDVLKEYAAFLFPNDSEVDRIAWVKSPAFSACGCFVRATYRDAGGGDIPEVDPGFSYSKFVNLPYKNRAGNVISDLRNLSKSRSGLKYDIKQKPRKKLSELNIQQGDTVFIANYVEGSNVDLSSSSTHVLLVLEEEEGEDGKRIFTGVQGGTSNTYEDPGGGPSRGGTGQRINNIRVIFVEEFGTGKIRVRGEAAGNRYLIEIWDAEKTILG